MDEKKANQLLLAIEGISAELLEIKNELRLLVERNIKEHEEISTRIMILSEMFLQHDADSNSIKALQ